MTIVNVGVSYRFAPAEVLEKLAVPSAELGGVLARLHALPSIDEVAVLSTCNRLEVYAAVAGATGPATRAVAGLVAARGRIPAADVPGMARIHIGGAAAEHLFSVACGLDSIAAGEDQIVAQIEGAARAAVAAGTAGPPHPPDRRGAAGRQTGPHPDHDRHGRYLARPGWPGPRPRAPGRPGRPRCGGARDWAYGQARGPAAP